MSDTATIVVLALRRFRKFGRHTNRMVVIGMAWPVIIAGLAALLQRSTA